MLNTNHLMPTIDHTAEITGWSFPNCTEINMDYHKYRKHKTRYNMYKVGQMNSAYSKNLWNDRFREQ